MNFCKGEKSYTVDRVNILLFSVLDKNRFIYVAEMKLKTASLEKLVINPGKLLLENRLEPPRLLYVYNSPTRMAIKTKTVSSFSNEIL